MEEIDDIQNCNGVIYKRFMIIAEGTMAGRKGSPTEREVVQEKERARQLYRTRFYARAFS